MKYGLTIKDMQWAQSMMRNPSEHDWVMDVLRCVYEMRRLNMKTINYCGMTFEVEERFNYIATDDDGSIWVFEREPEYDFELGEWLVDGGDYQGLERDFKPEDSLENI